MPERKSASSDRMTSALSSMVLRIVKVAEGGLRGASRRVAIDRIVLDQLRLRQPLLRVLPLRSQRRRGDGGAQNVQALATRHACQVAHQRRLEVRKGARLQVIEDMLRTVRIVETEQRSLAQGVRATHAHRVLGIAVYLDRTVRIALDQQRKRAGRERKGRREVVRSAQNEVFRRFDIGIDRLIGLLGASREAGHGHGGAHQLHEAAARDRVHPLARVRPGTPARCGGQNRGGLPHDRVPATLRRLSSSARAAAIVIPCFAPGSVPELPPG